MNIGATAAVYVISVAAELAGMHPQTLRQYDRMGLVVPKRTAGAGRRYSPRDIERLRLIQKLSKEDGINLAGIKEILALRRDLDEAHDAATQAHAAVHELRQQIEGLRQRVQAESRVFAAGQSGDIVSVMHGRRPRVRIAGALPSAASARPGGSEADRASRDILLYRRR